MRSCHLEPSLECFHLDGVCHARGYEVQSCDRLRHYLRDHLQKIKPITPIEMARDYERAYSQQQPIRKIDVGEDQSCPARTQTHIPADTYHRPDDDFGGQDGSAGRER